MNSTGLERETPSKDVVFDESHPVDNAADDLELRGLLSGQQTKSSDRKLPYQRLQRWLESGKEWSRKQFIVVVMVFAMLLLGATVSLPLLGSGPPKCNSHPNTHFAGDKLRTNGTHEYKRTVLLISIDGLRADYTERGLTPHLLDISTKGLRAKYMKPIFPTLTFPNHWALMTGLYAESHGIVANDFWDPQSQSQFHYNRESSTWQSHWWQGEPMWETTGKASMISANLMWPGPPKLSSGAAPSYFVPWKDKVPLSEKLEQIVQWLELPLEDRPQLITAYEPSLDQAGHKAGPNSKLVNDTLTYVDGFAKDLYSALVARNLTEIVDVIFVSDHGMTDTSHPELVYLDDLLGEAGFESIEHTDGWPCMGLRFSQGANISHHLSVLLEAASKNSDKFHVYTHDTMPERYHFVKNDRIAPVYVVPEIGYVLTTRKEGDVGMMKGNHGYDNSEPSMFATFVAHGPFATTVKDIHFKRSMSFPRSLLPRKYTNVGWDKFSNKDATYVIQGFENVQIYGLVTKLLGIEDFAASNNATKGFWDRYF